MPETVICEHCGEDQPNLGDAFCSNCREPIATSEPTPIATDTNAQTARESVQFANDSAGLKLVIFGFLAIVFALFTLLSLLSIIGGSIGIGNPLATAGSIFGGFIYTIIYGAISAGCWIGFKNTLNAKLHPATHSPQGKLDILVRETLDIDARHVTTKNFYANASDAELLMLHRKMTTTGNASRLPELVYEARRRTGHNVQPDSDETDKTV